MTQIGEDTKVTLDLKTIGMIVGFAISLSSMYFILQADIAKAMTLPIPEVTSTEFQYKDQIIREAIITTQEDVHEMKETLKLLEMRLYEISKK
jgi:hypothetical protein|tara:strand:+ start:54 stop:332 length:279 start_codon:yes stop_codon:yes gene_type:complete